MQKIRHLRTITKLCRAISSQLRHVSTIRKKNLLTSNISSTCPHSMVNFGPLTAEISWRVLGTPANFNRFRILASLLLGLIGALQIGSVFAFVCVFLYEVWLAPELVHYIMVALCNRTDHNIFMPFLLLLLLLFFLA